jgi:hypothetical protein
MLRRTASPNREDVPDPSILHEILLVVCGFHHDVWSKPSDLEAPLWIQHPQPIERGRGQQMHEGTVKKGTLGQTEVGDGIPVLEAFDIWPVLLSWLSVR